MAADERDLARLVATLVRSTKDSGFSAADCVSALRLAAEAIATGASIDHSDLARTRATDLSPGEAEALARILNIRTLLKEQGGL
ncbi:hypothetical protein R70006_06213 [Paraburkholderia domus]|uniref:hypothetical protein n=1 Tax=Paraburkholderia domus TaxID=2793075 RepID=UPI00191137A4|nr:hypothetical protein [Paraburkholderia domus]MBK5052845.1 hypothetical protein [Burkholderia sp. R-70006]CAE6821347.1 hypothetical protein R70006_06213 [Paraburkholderia domus]